MEKEEQVPKKKSVLLLIILSIITLKIYPFIWYFKRADELNNLKTTKKLSKKFALAILLLTIILFILAIVLSFFTRTTLTETVTDISQIPLPFLINLGLIVFLIPVILIMYLFLAFRTRTILNQVLVNKESKVKLSWFFTLIFNFYYLQYEINRIINDKEEKKRVGPWVILLLIIFLIVVPIMLIILYRDVIESYVTSLIANSGLYIN
jgi:hypothetical protein